MLVTMIDPEAVASRLDVGVPPVFTEDGWKAWVSFKPRPLPRKVSLPPMPLCPVCSCPLREEEVCDGCRDIAAGLLSATPVR